MLSKSRRRLAVFLGTPSQILHTYEEEAPRISGSRQGCAAEYGRGASIVYARLLLSQYFY
jgi:hypothetical protein